MEYAEKGDLTKQIRKARDSNAPIPEEFIWLIAFQICMGVGYLHSLKTVHRDLKCMNIFLTKDNVIKIGDFGVSKMSFEPRFDAASASKAGRAGTPMYLSPEVIRQNPYDFKIDSWAIGCCLYNLATLEPPFQSENLN